MVCVVEVSDKVLDGYRLIDLFAGLGGFRLALGSLGAECVYSNEWDKNVAGVYRKNFGVTPDGDITRADARDVPDHDILCAGFPCQAFSISGKQRGLDDSRGTLFFDVARIVHEKRPKVVLMENVRSFATHDGGRTLDVVKTTMEELGCCFYHKVLNSADYGVPQSRNRVYMVCFRNDLGVSDFTCPSVVTLTRHVEDVLLDDAVVQNMYIDRDDMRLNGHVDDVYANKPIRLGRVGKGGQGERVYSVKGPAITLSAYGGGVFARTGGYLVGGRTRRLHPRECARLMGFPDSYVISDSKTQAYQQFGNSVVVDVLQMIGLEIGKALRQVSVI